MNKAYRESVKQMKIGEAAGSVVKAGILVACIYAVVKLDLINPQDESVSNFAEKACVNEIRDRFDASQVRAYSVKETNNGYVVRASITLPRGNTAKVYCVTNQYGGVKEITIEER